MTKAVIMATWDDVPHLNAKDKADMLMSYPPYQRDARSKGVPQLGSGAIYPIPESDLAVEPFDAPAFWPRAYGLDVGWNKTAAVFGAQDREHDVIYILDEYYRGQAEPATHAEAIKRRAGTWMPGAIDPASRGRGQGDGEQLMQSYIDLGLQIHPAINAVEAGIFEVYIRMTTGRLKIAKHLVNLWTEFRLYRRDDKGNVVKKMDHAMDALRYLVMTIAIATTNPDYLRRMGHGIGGDRGEYDPLAGM